MRGQQKFDIPIPVNGYAKDRPTQLFGLDSLIAGQNMLLDIDGYYRPRNGYMPWFAINPTEALLGLATYTDTDGSYQYVGAGAQNVWVVNSGAWVSKGGNLHSSPDNLISIVPYLQPFIDGAITTFLSAIFCNDEDPLFLWNQALSAAQPLTPVHAAGSGNTLAFNTTPTFAALPVSNPGPNWFFTVTGSNTGATTLNINSIGAKSIMYISGGVLTSLPSGYLAPGTVYNVSYDGTEFIIGTNVVAPICRHICALNGRIVGVDVTSGAVRVPYQVTWSEAFDGTLWPPLNFQNMLDTSDQLIAAVPIGFNAAVVHGLKTGYLMQGVFGANDANAFSFTPINGYKAGPASPLAIIPYAGGQLWLGQDFRFWTTDGYSAQPFVSAGGVPTAVLQGTLSNGLRQRFFAFDEWNPRRYWFMCLGNSNSNSIGVVLGNEPQPHFETLQYFPTTFTAATPVLSLSSATTWADLTNPWYEYPVPWNSFLQSRQMTQIVSDSSAVHQFGQHGGVTDDGTAIFYSMTPGLLTQGPEQDIRPESFDLFAQLGAQLELATLQFDGLAYPDDPGATVLAAIVNYSDPATFVTPQVYPEMATYSRYLRVTLSGYSIYRQLAYGGMRVYCNLQGRASA